MHYYLVVFLCSLTWCVGMMFVLEPRVSLKAVSLSLGIEVRSVYIPPSPDPISSFAICGIYWVWLLLLLHYYLVKMDDQVVSLVAR
ncbi:hypothetical protein Hanom_Chr15g01352971 [Helianthus anomalus]